MENKDISQMALEKIKESGIKPISKNVFNIKKVLFWSLVGFFLFVGAVSFSVVLSILFNNDWYLYNRLGFSFIFRTLPYFWFICLLLFAILGEFYYRKTFLGYRHRMTTIIGVYIIITVTSGLIFNIIGLGNIIDESLSQNVPFYKGFMFDRNEFWSHPEQGLFFGRVIEVNEDMVKIIDGSNNIWVINIDNDTFIGGQTEIKIGDMVKIVGDKDDNNVFRADEIRFNLYGLNRDCCTAR